MSCVASPHRTWGRVTGELGVRLKGGIGFGGPPSRLGEESAGIGAGDARGGWKRKVEGEGEDSVAGDEARYCRMLLAREAGLGGVHL